MPEYKLEMLNISKSFGGVKALDNVTFCLRPGEVHALMGENGAGKSTLMKILSGAYTNNSGSIKINGKEVEINSTRDAKNLGIATIYQEFMLAPDLTVAENIFIDRLSEAGKVINWKKLYSNATELLHKLGFDNISPSARCGSLSVAGQQVVEICKCLSRNAKILVFDEPTAVLTINEIDKLFSLIKKLQKNGVSIIYISHRIDEVFNLCQEITVLKDGRNVETVKTDSISKHDLINMMVGRELNDMFPDRHSKIGDVILKVDNLSAGSLVHDVSFEVHRGEILGFNGLVGSGRTETMRAIFGIDKKSTGTITYKGKQVNWNSPRDAIKDRFGMLPEDRKNQGLLLKQSIRINTTLASLPSITKKGFINIGQEKKIVDKYLKEVNTKYASTEDNANSLSGGNQQKIVFAKWIAANCDCMVFDEPTRGVDVGAKSEIYKIINELAENGMAIIMISSEMPEIIGMCDRVIVMRNGTVSGEISKDELNEKSLIQYSMGVSKNEA